MIVIVGFIIAGTTWHVPLQSTTTCEFLPFFTAVIPPGAFIVRSFYVNARVTFFAILVKLRISTITIVIAVDAPHSIYTGKFTQNTLNVLRTILPSPKHWRRS